jgi:hypothetical protein
VLINQLLTRTRSSTPGDTHRPKLDPLDEVTSERALTCCPSFKAILCQLRAAGRAGKLLAYPSRVPG